MCIHTHTHTQLRARVRERERGGERRIRKFVKFKKAWSYISTQMMVKAETKYSNKLPRKFKKSVSFAGTSCPLIVLPLLHTRWAAESYVEQTVKEQIKTRTSVKVSASSKVRLSVSIKIFLVVRKSVKMSYCGLDIEEPWFDSPQRQESFLFSKMCWRLLELIQWLPGSFS